MDLELKDKVVIVTGGAKGIGAAIVRLLAGEGAVPVIVDRDGDAGAQLQNVVRSQGAACGLVTVELANPEDCSRAVEQAAAYLHLSPSQPLQVVKVAGGPAQEVTLSGDGLAKGDVRRLHERHRLHHGKCSKGTQRRAGDLPPQHCQPPRLRNRQTIYAHPLSRSFVMTCVRWALP